MILLDTNYLIGVLVRDSPEAARVIDWYRDEELCVSAVAWYEFLCGPVDAAGEMVVRGLIRDRILPYTADQASESARLFNAVGRARSLRVDAMIAAASIVANARLGTANVEDFKRFEPFGLRLA